MGVYFETGVFIQATGKNPHAYTTAKTPFLSVTCLHGAGTLGTNCSSSLFNLACQQHEESQTITLSPPTYLYFIRGKNQSLAPIFIFVMLPVSIDPGLMDFSPYVHENTFSRGKALPVGKDSEGKNCAHNLVCNRKKCTKYKLLSYTSSVGNTSTFNYCKNVLIQ